MTALQLSQEKVATLAALANGIIPTDEKDRGAEEVNAGPRLAERIRAGTSAALYLQGLETAETIAQDKFRRSVVQLNPNEIHKLIGSVRDQLPAFFKQLRMDVSALYLSDSGVWQRIGFPGPSTRSGGYPDFDRPQTEKMTRLKEPLSKPLLGT